MKLRWLHSENEVWDFLLLAFSLRWVKYIFLKQSIQQFVGLKNFRTEEQRTGSLPEEQII